MEEGKAFWLTPQGTRAMHLSERRTFKAKPTIQKPSTLKYAVDTYINVANEDDSNDIKLVRACSGINKEAIDAGLVSIDDLQRRGIAFNDIDSLISDRKLVEKSDIIASRISSEYSVGSDEWSRWTNQTDKYNVTIIESLRHDV